MLQLRQYHPTVDVLYDSCLRFRIGLHCLLLLFEKIFGIMCYNRQFQHEVFFLICLRNISIRFFVHYLIIHLDDYVILEWYLLHLQSIVFLSLDPRHKSWKTMVLVCFSLFHVTGLMNQFHLC